jgi:L-rhamnose isomerase/sugar isomerase
MDVNEVKMSLKSQKIETPSWAYADSGTRFHVFRQPSAARTLREKLEDAAQVHRFTGICPSVAIHIPWDAVKDWGEISAYARELGLSIGAVNPNLFGDDDYKLGSLASPFAAVRAKAVAHVKECIGIAEKTGSKIISLWISDGTDFPGQDSFRGRKTRLEDALGEICGALPAGFRLLLEYKFFEPSFYHTDLFDWGTASMLCRKLGAKAQVLVDIGHHPLGTNVEQIVAYLLDEKLLGGFHFNDKKYADDDLVTGSVNPYQLFLIFCELADASLEEKTAGPASEVAYMIDESHNLKSKIEATIQSAIAIQESYAKALLLDRGALAAARREGRIVDAEECVKDAFKTDVRPLLGEVREEMGLDPDPLGAFRKSGYAERALKTRAGTMKQ